MQEDIDKILAIFEEISTIPRESKNEQQIHDWLMNWGKKHGFETMADQSLNVVIKVPASPGFEQAPIIVLQAHMDMVCEKTPDSQHDFLNDPIQLIRDGDWLTANQTTLGADNGIGLALALFFASEPSVKHPAMELLFTVDEESGLFGVQALKPGFIAGKILINLDSEEEGYFTIGCAGGADNLLQLDVQPDEPLQDKQLLELTVGGLQGGHSGVDIQLNLANANALIIRILKQISQKMPVYLLELNGGNAHNAIPRDARAIFAVSKNESQSAQKTAGRMIRDLTAEYKKSEPRLFIQCENTESKTPLLLNQALSQKIIDLLMAMPHGIMGMSFDIEDLVETSTNFAKMVLTDKKLEILTSQRSSVKSKLNWIISTIEGLAGTVNAQVTRLSQYPGWQPNLDSALLKRCQNLYQELYSRPPVILAIHAGLECGQIGEIYGEMDMISLGPDLERVHTPDERINVPSIGRIANFMRHLLASWQGES